MIRTSFITVLVLICSSVSFAQRKEIILPSFQFRFHAFPVGSAIEKKVFKNTSLVFDVGAGAAAMFGKKTVSESVTKITLVPYSELQMRRYLNKSKRYKIGKKYDYYTGGYAAFQTRFSLATRLSSGKLISGLLYGYQKVYGSGFYFCLSIGIGTDVLNSFRAGLITDSRFGFIL
ncbi:MAG: hypothetical protein KJ607_04635 [Bacteroidetes bacterium]|nr:hypothetical protein [Bacteroidota bacterium]